MGEDFWWWIDNTERELKILKEQITLMEKYTWTEKVDKIELVANFPVETCLMQGEIENYIEPQFKQNLRKISFAMSFAIFENQMLYLCEKLYQMGKTSRSIYATKKLPGIEDTKNYLENEIKMKLTILNGLWEKIKLFKDIRNIVLHYNGFLRVRDYREKRIKEFMEKNGKLTFDDKIRIVGFQEGFCEEVIGTILEFCRKIDDNLKLI